MDVLVRIWLGDEDQRIRMRFPNGLITTVALDGHDRKHAHLYGHLQAILQEAGKWRDA